MSWDFDSGSKKAEFTKFPVGVTRIRIIDIEPFIRWVHWLPTARRSANCPGKGCPICDIRHRQKANKEPYSYAMSRRFAMNVLNRETGKVEIMEQGLGFFEDLKDLMFTLKESGKSFIDVDIKVKRRGTGVDDTSYRLDIADEYPLTEEEVKLISEKTNLTDYFKPHTIEQLTKIINGESWDTVMSANSQEDKESDEEITIL